MAASPVFHEHVTPGHVVQFYGRDTRSLISNVSSFLADALKRGDGALVIATPEHRTAIYRKLWTHELSPHDAALQHRLVMLDAGKTLAQFMVAGKPDWDRFESMVGGTLKEFQKRNAGVGGHAYGEMVGLLWKAKRYSEAIRLEQYWNRLLESGGFSLFCGYPVDVFASDFHSDAMGEVLSAHSHLLPGDDQIEVTLHRAMDEVLGPLSDQIRELFSTQQTTTAPCLPPGEGLVRWLCANMPDDAEEILKLARRYSVEAHLNS